MYGCTSIKIAAPFVAGLAAARAPPRLHAGLSLDERQPSHPPAASRTTVAFPPTAGKGDGAAARPTTAVCPCGCAAVVVVPVAPTTPLRLSPRYLTRLPTLADAPFRTLRFCDTHAPHSAPLPFTPRLPRRPLSNVVTPAECSLRPPPLLAFSFLPPTLLLTLPPLPPPWPPAIPSAPWSDPWPRRGPELAAAFAVSAGAGCDRPPLLLPPSPAPVPGPSVVSHPAGRP